MKNQILFLLMTITFSASVLAETSTRFPMVTGKNLHGDAVTFPEAFGGTRYNLTIIAFEQKQQPTVDTWLPQLAQVEKERDDFVFYELPTIAKMNRLMRWVIYRGMRSGIKEDRARWRTVTLHIDKAPFRRSLGIENEKSIKLFLMNDKGLVLWQSEGAFTPEKLQSLTKTLQTN